MIIDADCHVSSRAGTQEGMITTVGGMGVDQLIREMDVLGVDRAIAWPMVSYTREMASDNRVIYEGASAHPDRIIPFGGVNPRLGLDEAIAELKRCIEVYGVKGVKLNGARDIYYIDDPHLSLPLVDMIAEAGLAVAFHCGANDFEKTHPFRIAKISERHPDLSVFLVHMGGSGRPNMHDSVIELATQYPNWYLIDSEADYRKVHKALNILGPDRVCFGSDTPFCPMRFELGIRQVIYQDLSQQDRALVMGGNVARILNLVD